MVHWSAVTNGPRTLFGVVNATDLKTAAFGTFAVTAAFEGLRSFENTINAAQILTRPVVGLTEIVLACAMIGILILKPGGIIETSEIGELSTWNNLFGRKSS